jgi:nucleoid-associated protein YgaU
MNCPLISAFYFLLVSLSVTLVPLSGHADTVALTSGDTVHITVENYPEMNTVARINATGAIDMPLIGEVQTQGLTAAQLARRLTSLLADGYLKNPLVSVSTENQQATAPKDRQASNTISEKNIPDSLPVTAQTEVPSQPVDRGVPMTSSGEEPASTAGREHTVGQGDTLQSLSLQYYGTEHKWSVIEEANRKILGSNPHALEIGMLLIIPTAPGKAADSQVRASTSSLSGLNGDGTYTVQSGDTLSSIAQKLYGAASAWVTIYEANQQVLSDSAELKVGQVLRLQEPPRTLP